MNYIQTNLLPNEKIALQAKIHWIVMVKGCLVFLCVGLMFFPYIFLGMVAKLLEAQWMIGIPQEFMVAALLIGAFIYMLNGFILYFCTEFAVTDKRVIVKLGLIQRDTYELNLNRVTSLNVDQSIIGRLLNYGDITVVGMGGSLTPIRAVIDPLNFRKIVLTEVEGTKLP
jgi:uncharacterized membrane protein YdbT with pleckstrin-like domain